MNIFERLMRRRPTRQKSRYSDVQWLNIHMQCDLGIDRMAVEHQRNARLRQQLAP